jgi:DNA-binding IclR family transcriptional regulator
MRTLAKAFEILDSFSEENPEFTLTEIVNRTGYSKTATHRLLKTLLSYNYLIRLPNTAKYRLGPKLFELGSLFINQLNLPRVARPYLEKIAKKTGDTAFFCVRDKTEALCLERIEGENTVRTFLLLKGGRLPLHTGASPLVLLAGMSDTEIYKIMKKRSFKCYTDNTIQNIDQLMGKIRKIRRDGYVISWEDLTVGVASVGAPVRDYTKKVVAAVSVAGIIQRFRPDQIERIVDIVTSNALFISRKIGYSTN